MSNKELLQNYLNDIGLLEDRLSIYYDKLFGPASEIAEICDEISYLDRRMEQSSDKQQKIAKLKDKQTILLQQLHSLEKEEPSCLPHNLEKVKQLTIDKVLDNDALCKALTTPRKQCTWKCFTGQSKSNKPLFYYGIKFIKGYDEYHCFIGSTTSSLKADIINRKLKNMNWYQAITDFNCRDRFKSNPTCFRIPQELRKAIISELIKETAKTQKTSQTKTEEEKTK